MILCICTARKAVRSLFRTGIVLTSAMAQVACNREVAVPPGTPSLGLKTSSFTGDTIPAKYSSCSGERSVSPELSWSTPPASTQSFALIAYDRDSPLGFHFVHWVLYNLRPDKRELSEDLARQDHLPDGSRQGQNGYDTVGYAGPCPPGHSPHRYVFDLYALDKKLNLPAGATKKDVVKAMDGHVLAWGELVGHFQH